MTFKDNCSLISSDKALITASEPGHMITNGVRTHNALLGPSDRSGAVIGALDQDWKVTGIVSVDLFTEIPKSATSSFMYLKNHPLYASQPSYMIKFVRDEEVELFKEILLVVTDGGGDHNISHASIKVALIYLFSVPEP